MAQFNSTVLTQKGIALLAKVQAGRCTLSLTKAVSGSGVWAASEDPSTATALKSQKQEFGISAFKVQNSVYVYVRFVITNNPDSGALSNGYYVYETGIYATDPDEGEILYAIATASVPDYLPAYDDLAPSTITMEMLTEVANADEVTLMMMEHMHIYDNTTGDRYEIGVDNGSLYYENLETGDVQSTGGRITAVNGQLCITYEI